MINRITVFTGSRKDFEKYITGEVDENERTVTLLEFVQQHQARMTPRESLSDDYDLNERFEVDNLVVRTDDYASVREHVLANFASVIDVNHNIKRIFVHNPPKQLLFTVKSRYGDVIDYEATEYPKVTREKLETIFSNLNADIFGQENAKRQIIAGMYRLITQRKDKPVVIMMYGPSGVGKTESAKSISRSMGGELLRIQFSMMQNSEAINYVFGAEHSKSSFARDLLSRESNVILIDEFDKVNSIFYNAFYELFDEGQYNDANYSVDLGQTVFFLTSNFRNVQEIKNALGPAMFSRIGLCLEYNHLSEEQKLAIIQKTFHKTLSLLQDDEKEVIQNSDILDFFQKNAKQYNNIRTLKTNIENAVFMKLTDCFITKHHNSEWNMQ